MKPYSLIVFDWDGTLMDSTANIVKCMRTAIKNLKMSTLEDDAISHIIGLGLYEAVQALYPSANKTVVEALGGEYRRVWLASPDQTPLFAHAKTLIERLSQQDYFVAVATGKSRQGLDKVLKSAQLAPFFHATRCADECHSKPHPEMLEQLIDYCGVRPDQTLMIGDTEYDLKMADNAGADSLAVSHGAHGVATLKACGPQAIVSDLFEVEKWINSLSSPS